MLTSPVHVVMMKYPLYFSHNLTSFSFEQLFQPLEDTFVNTLVGWSSWRSLESFTLNNSPNLSLMSANTILGSCPRVKRIGSLATWGRVDREQLEAFKQEVNNRNFDLEVN